MDTKIKILFLVHTEYHMMVSLSIIADLYDDSEKFELTIYQTINKKKNRFGFEKNINLIDHLTFKRIEYDERSNDYDENLVVFISSILNYGYDVFIMFNHHMFVPVFLAKQLYKQGAEVYLAPDGLKVYNESRKITPRWSVQDALKYWKFTRVNKLPYDFMYPTLTYANLKEIKKVFVHFPETFNNYKNKEVLKLSVLSTVKAINLVKNYFKFNINEELSTLEKIIFYINQPVIKQSICDFEIELLKYLQIHFPDHKLIVKLHPLTDKVQKEKIKSFNNIQLITKSYPAELYIAELKDSLVISFWSTACLLNNLDTKVYWLYPALKKRKIMLNYVKIKNPTNHIIEVEEFAEIS